MVEKISLDEWKDKYMSDMYIDSFNAKKEANLEKCDFVLLCRDYKNEAVGFLTCHELDSETLYWQYGGATKKVKNTINVSSHYVSFIKWSLERYKRVTTRIENTNTPMLRIALKCGFLIYGIWNFKNKIYVELCNEGV
jgi:RimJ/RimL family protein N-acetyltransferase